MNKKIGLVVMFRLEAGGGAPRLVIDLIKDLNLLGYTVSLLNPFKLDYNHIEKMYNDPIKIAKVYGVNPIKRVFCKNSILGRKIIKKEFKKMAKDVDMIIDIDGGIVHKYLPKNFDKSKYIVWRFAATKSKSANNLKNKRGIKRIIKDFIKKILFLEQNKTKNSLSKKYRVYPIDEMAKKRLAKIWGLSPEEILPHTIHTEDFLYKGQKKKNQIAVAVRFAPNKMIENSIKIFYLGTKKYKKYNLIIAGGITPDSERYIEYLVELTKKLGIQDRVKMIKNPSTEELKNIMLESKVLIDSQEDISMAMAPVESMAAGNIILAHKSNGTYQETLMNGKFGFGFESIKEGGEQMEKILEGLERKTINNKKSIKRADFCSEKNFIKRLKEVLE
ncbi:glycosyltransferase [Candidatus Pacearchaeota archaeon]|nr:glycosyltransferase [Candidatus Pacearchaeota archaeon]